MQSNALDVSHGPVAAVARLFPRELLTRHAPKYSLIAHTTTTMANTSVATANTFSKEATLISLSASSPICRLGDSLIRMQSRGRGRVHVIFGLCWKSHSSVRPSAPDDTCHPTAVGNRRRGEGERAAPASDVAELPLIALSAVTCQRYRLRNYHGSPLLQDYANRRIVLDRLSEGPALLSTVALPVVFTGISLSSSP
jgi:hypothetical protein